MKQEIEIEFKNLVTKEEFQLLMETFHLTSEAFFKQTNYYFDTPTMELKAQQSALRIREKNDTYTLTLKQPQQSGLLESHQSLTKEEAMHIINGQATVTGDMEKLLTTAAISVNDLTMFGSLTTERAETNYKGGILVLDHSYYFDCDDYEIEYEVTDEQTGQHDFHALLEHLCIPIRKTENKIKRFYLEKKKREG